MSMTELKAVMFDWGHTILDEDWDRELPLNTAPVHLMPGVKDTLPRIKLPMGLWANTNSYSASDIGIWLKRAGIGDYFDCVVTSSDVGFRKPDGRFFSAALEKCGFTKDEVIFVGNQLNSDIKGANDYGIRNVWLSGEAFRSKDETFTTNDIQPTYSIDSLTELPNLIESIQSEKF